ncbi:MAG: 16S rRNA (uracil(1498)-N(3))-methyltransferase [Acidimicrobiia bacterium]|nr:16S rRNA (uracil(1498)-N(3))-methyltransferase [Acidimicrobiia bacterium]
MLHRFFAPTLDAGDDAVTLPRDEGEHLVRVLRLGVGDSVTVFDGRGHEFVGRVVAAARRDVRVQVLSRVDPVAEPTVAITLAQAVLKGERMDDVIRDGVMLGVSAIQPIVAKRSETTVGALLRGARMERWRRVALASVKQSRRATLPDIRTPLTFEHYLDEPAALRLMLVEPSAPMDPTRLTPLRSLSVPVDAGVLVGPEGGWDVQECTLAMERGVRMISLGPRTLRADAVPIATLSVLQFLWES